MSKDNITDWDETPANNEDIGGIDIRSTAKPANFDDSQRAIISQIAKVNKGTAPVADTWTFADPADLTKRARLDAGNVTAGQTRVITAPDFNIDLADLMRVSRGFIYGLTLSNAADADHDITIAAGTAASDDSNPLVINLASAITKQADATFAEGTAAGGMVSGESLPTSGTVNVWLIRKADGTADVCFNNYASSLFSPTLPSGFVYKRRIGSLRTDASANIRGFVQTGDEFMLLVPVQDSTTTSLSTTAVTFGCSIPAGIKHLVIGSGFTSQAGAPNFSIRISDPDRTDSAVSSATLMFNSTATNIPNAFGNVRVRASTSGTIRVRGSGANTSFTWNTEGWVDTRGRFA